MNVTRGVILKTISNIIVKATWFVTFPIMARYLGSDGYGAYGQLMTVMTFIVPFASFGVGGAAIVRFMSINDWTRQNRRWLGKILLFVVSSACVISLLFALLAPVINHLFLGWDRGVELFRWGSAFIFVGALEMLIYQVLRSRLWLEEYAAFEIIQTLINVSAIIYLVPRGYGLIYLIKTLIVLKILFYAVMISGFWTWHKIVASDKETRTATLTRMMRFGLPMSFVGLGTTLTTLGDRLVIGHYLTAADLGIYGAVCVFYALIEALNSPIMLPLYPQLMKVVDGNDPAGVAYVVGNIHKYSLLVIVPSFFLLSVIVKPLLLLMGGAEFETGLTLIILILLRGVVGKFNSIAHYMLMCKDRVVFIQNSLIAAGLANLALSYIIVPYMGLTGAALSGLICFVALESVVFLQASRYAPLKSLYRMDILAKATVASLAAIGVIMLWNTHLAPDKFQLLFATAVFGAVYLAVIVILKGIDRSDIEKVIKALAPKIISRKQD
ncbi:MAG TPA: oligosaccharide flippase family protein [bacterium]|nr:oligosaccharide flippase family protein [bacterium]